MKKIFIPVLFIAILIPVSARSQALTSFMAGHGFAGAKLERRFGNHLFVNSVINKQHAALMIDTGAPFTFIDKNSAATFGLVTEQTKSHVGGAFGFSWERFEKSTVKSIAMGNCAITNVPVALSDASGMNTYSRLQHINGLLGLREMHKFGMVIDCTRQMLYINPNGPSAAFSQQLSGLLAGRGFTRVPIRLTSSDHFIVEGALNGHPTQFILDTGASTTSIDKKIAVKSGIGFDPLPKFTTSGFGGGSQMMSRGNVKELAIGGFTLTNPEVEVVTYPPDIVGASGSTAGFLGAEYLAFNFGVIDVSGRALYLRHPDKK